MTASTLRIQAYLDVVQRYPDAFANRDSEGIRILTNPSEILAAEATVKVRYQERGLAQEWAECGVFYEDPWMYLVRDVVIFPDGAPGTYHHILFKGGLDGVVILPVYQGKIVLLRHFRNGARDWSWEIPRGGPRRVDPEQNAIGEIEEELDGKIVRIERIGNLKNNNGMISETMQIFYAELSSIGKGNLGEGITETRLLAPKDLEGMIASGEIDDSHTVHAYALACMKGLIDGETY